MSSGKLSGVQQAMALLIEAFYKYSGKEGDKYTLSKGELKDLLNNEFKGLLVENKDQAPDLNEIFKDLDANKDGQVDFQEYVVLVCAITMVTNEFFREAKQKKK